jgi:hypothetical protein
MLDSMACGRVWARLLHTDVDANTMHQVAMDRHPGRTMMQCAFKLAIP